MRGPRTRPDPDGRPRRTSRASRPPSRPRWTPCGRILRMRSWRRTRLRRPSTGASCWSGRRRRRMRRRAPHRRDPPAGCSCAPQPRPSPWGRRARSGRAPASGACSRIFRRGSGAGRPPMRISRRCRIPRPGSSGPGCGPWRALRRASRSPSRPCGRRCGRLPRARILRWR